VLIASAILFALGMLVLLSQAILVVFSLLKIAYYLAKGAVYLVVLVVCVVALGVQYALSLARRLEGKPEPAKPEPAIVIDICDDNATPIELPRTSFRRLRG
jgi:hypothetical protein